MIHVLDRTVRRILMTRVESEKALKRSLETPFENAARGSRSVNHIVAGR